ncbi:hypothetical protein FDB55_03925 [Clostridium botulinum]|uniref:hypothetical protein n=1 Tax=Clostridium botulinum TaxID=1491 RepID=UPI0006A6F3EF|nr:hypothetical protein [Clostridium botulinum]KAI3346575.1 hypothetical protein CIT18_13905 [Clostridium botulinum]KOM86592.1 hypothetical protein ACP51_16370 [Clostridium botulinum]KOR55755.1 hypothetical protein ADT22_14595 [Clostridium botulinum]MCS6111347.1 hypothetical protein [Clostridium botulinum]NFL42576.1 hypothetical protein [Clostridium botulinum]
MISFSLKNNIYDLPVQVDSDYKYYSKLIERFDEYLEEISDTKIYNNSELICNVKENIELLKESLNFYRNANIDGAKKKILDILKKYINNNTIITTIDKSYACRGLSYINQNFKPDKDLEYEKNLELNFFRARIGNENFTRKDLLHIPFNKRNLITTERFGIPGVPCLYLGTTSYVCWLEMNKPIENDFNVTSYKIPKNLNIIDLTFVSILFNQSLSAIKVVEVWNKCSNEEKRLHADRIELWPLIIATSFNIKEKDRKFKSEYIISHLIMQCLNDLNLDGISYISNKISDLFVGYPYCVNFVLPMKQTDFDTDENIYSKEIGNYTLTDPVRLSEYRMLENCKIEIKSYLNQTCNNTNSRIDFAGKIIKYNECIFSKFDDYLVNQHYANYNNLR